MDNNSLTNEFDDVADGDGNIYNPPYLFHSEDRKVGAVYALDSRDTMEFNNDIPIFIMVSDTYIMRTFDGSEWDRVDVPRPIHMSMHEGAVVYLLDSDYKWIATVEYDGSVTFDCDQYG